MGMEVSPDVHFLYELAVTVRNLAILLAILASPFVWSYFGVRAQRRARERLKIVFEQLKSAPRRESLDNEIILWKKSGLGVRRLSDQHVRLETPATLWVANWCLNVWLDGEQIERLGLMVGRSAEKRPPSAPAEWVNPQSRSS